MALDGVRDTAFEEEFHLGIDAIHLGSQHSDDVKAKVKNKAISRRRGTSAGNLQRSSTVQEGQILRYRLTEELGHS